MKIKFDKAYESKRVEQYWYERWIKAGCFKAQDSSNKPAFCLVIPPPNVTGSLHMGHALDETLQDILVRYKRMDGFNALWMPGTDHAGIATQNVVEKQLAARGTNREQLGREAFIEEVWRWKAESGGKIVEQLKRLGASCDWQRERFTMDEGLSKAVRHTFVELFEQGYIYRDNYIINWCPRCKTALSDLEVEHEELNGKLYTIRYPLLDSKEFILVATTRPETMLGDTAVAVHPDDERYKKLVGKKIYLPLTDRQIPIVADESVKMEFGTGAVKITPAHDFNDFETGKRHQLPTISVMDESANMHVPGMRYHGMVAKAARKAVVEDLQLQELLVEEKPHPHQVGHCYRCKTVVEPRISKQWFVRTQELAKASISAVKDGRTKIIPQMWEKTYFEWMENIRDWCISRQIWWGHRIPVWYCQNCSEMTVSKQDPTQCSKCGNKKLSQDNDVLDTWFSSALWPFSTLGWPEKTAALKTFYPTTVLVTGFDILFFWVARMMMMGLKFMGDVPFRTVCIHALVRDAEGQKMSKSKGNVVDPLEIMDEYGTDALRFTLAALAVQGRDILLSEERINGYRHFVNKIWNATRFLAMNIESLQENFQITVEELKEYSEATGNKGLSAADLWINHLLNKTVVEVRTAFDEMRFSDAANSLYQFVWHQFCDWYIEMSKSHLNVEVGAMTPEKRSAALSTAGNLVRGLDTILRLLHPLMPFVTEEIWQKLMTLTGGEENEFLMLAPFPRASAEKPSTSKESLEPKEFIEIEAVKKIVTTLRTLKSENTISRAKRVEVFFVGATKEQQKLLSDHWHYVSDLAKLEPEQFSPELFINDAKALDQESGPLASDVVDGIQIFLPLGKLIDVDKERARLTRDIGKLEKDLEKLNGKLGNKEFVKNAPAEVVAEHREKSSQAQSELKSLQDFLKRLARA
jgi:valyl-tRNA synthetase